MTAVDLFSVPSTRPDDLSGLTAAGVDPGDVVALVAKTEGNGCVNDFSRMLAAAAWEAVLPREAVTVFSGGTEGVLSPHVNLFVRHGGGVAPEGGLVAEVARTPAVEPADLGRRPQAEAVASAVRGCADRLGLAAGDVHLVLVKCPLLTSDAVAKCLAAGVEPVTRDTYVSMARSRAASALGVALALGELPLGDLEDALEGRRPAWSSVASVSSGAELDDCHVLVLGTAAAARGPLAAKHAVMADALDHPPVQRLLDEIAAEGGEVVQLFAKAEPDPSGAVRGHRHTMLTDSDISGTRHARAAVGGLLAGIAGSPAIYVSGGAEHQGPPGGGPVTVVYRRPSA